MEKTFQVFQCLEKSFHHCFTANHMVAAPRPCPPPPPILGGGDVKVSDQNNWGDLSKKLIYFFLGGGAEFKGEPKILGGGSRAMNPNDVMVVVLKDILLIRF